MFGLILLVMAEEVVTKENIAAIRNEIRAVFGEPPGLRIKVASTLLGDGRGGKNAILTSLAMIRCVEGSGEFEYRFGALKMPITMRPGDRIETGNPEDPCRLVHHAYEGGTLLSTTVMEVIW
jgi:hypothetical protein